MITVLLAFILALVTTALATPIVRQIAHKVGAVDEPTARRVHLQRIPRMGGVAIVAGFFLPLVALLGAKTQVARLFFHDPRMVAGLAIGSVVVMTLGLFDDIVGVGAKRKLLVQVLAASAAWLGGLRIGAIVLPGLGALDLGWLSYPATVIWIVGIINALNLIDGLDGLAAGVAFFACITNFVAGYFAHNLLICMVTGALGGAIIGFLFHNFNPATIFMGDSGSMFLGFVVATTGLLGAGSTKSPTVIAILVPLLALGLPIMDMLFAVARRFVERRSIFAPDRGHIHHRLVDLGLTQRRAVLTLYGLSFVFTLGALALHLGRSWEIGLAMTALTVAVVLIVRFTGSFSAMISSRAERERAEPLVDQLRKSLPGFMRKADVTRGADDLIAMLKALGQSTALLAIEVNPDEGAMLPSWRWEIEEGGPQAIREAVCARFQIVDGEGKRVSFGFFIDSSTGAVSARSEVLLQLVVDAMQNALQRSGPVRQLDEARTGRFRGA